MKKLMPLILLTSLNAQSAIMCTDFFEDPTTYLFGLEFTFTTQRIVDEGNRNPKDYGLDSNPIKAEAWKNWMSAIEKKCAASGDCYTIMSYDKHGEALKVRFKDGFYFTVGIDSAALEVNAMPKSRRGFSDVKSRMEEYVFGTAETIGLKPHERAGQGHIHISTQAFKNGKALRNFFVDFQNRPEIIYGALGNHLGNSPPLAAQKAEQRAELVQVLKELDRSFFGYSIKTFAENIQKRVYTSSYFEDWGGPEYYQALNLTRVFKPEDSATIEIRSFRPQESPEMFQLQTILLERWVEKMNKTKEKIAFIDKSKFNYTGQEIVDAYHQLLRDLDLSWETFHVLLPAHLRSMKPTLLQ